ncbi:tRNA (adenine-N1)-methyltransferase [Natronocalculus amylovorans]|uniref:tRNA (Adenine-N1)-methyltransferase n=1 Tax=Natronocalculus amylovorans TaxID=2917812 RepID=A0AAE3K920_9EURY|nr:tRNA (adenine-N1)-methyltransferase [Natronocalculus amylovorans]MCL9817090.1 tRNA (adenine-N1)-methyltransferase [Natronocalculus amylovorans]NUE02882.1 tRNA (adenine-N1)-methyltransferase [Halorubraceae archaeon YAN]
MIVLVHGDREYVRAPGEELQTDLGVLTVPENVEPGDTLETHLGTEFTVRRLRGPDLFNHLERTGAPMMPRDIGLVIGHTGVESTDRVLDAGTGTGILSSYLGRLGATVTTYEQNAEFAETARENMRIAGVEENVTVRSGNIVENVDALITEGPFDVLTLDTGDAPDVVAHASELLSAGGYLAVYSPFVENTREVVTAARDAGLSDIQTLETLQRKMQFDDRGSRPSTRGVGHTGYLTFARNE